MKKDGRVRMPDHFFFFTAFALCVVGCSADSALSDVCREKLSPRLFNAVTHSIHDTVRISLVITLKDSTGLSSSFPMLSISNAQVALGHLTKAEISALCKQENVQYIDLPKMRFPNQ
jgi:hypothetical protein